VATNFLATNFLATNFLATNFLATNFHHDGIDLRLDRSADQSTGAKYPAIFFETIVRKSEKLDATNGESKPARGASTRRGPPPRRGARAKPQWLFNLSTEVSSSVFALAPSRLSAYSGCPEIAGQWVPDPATTEANEHGGGARPPRHPQHEVRRTLPLSCEKSEKQQAPHGASGSPMEQ
jgi:hypothetical protein